MASQPLAPQSGVFFQLKSLGLRGLAQVRHCTERGPGNSAIGVEFPTPPMREEIGPWQFRQVRQTDGGWSEEWEASLNLAQYSARY
jgi:hypothetical protein